MHLKFLFIYVITDPGLIRETKWAGSKQRKCAASVSSVATESLTFSNLTIRLRDDSAAEKDGAHAGATAAASRSLTTLRVEGCLQRRKRISGLDPSIVSPKRRREVDPDSDTASVWGDQVLFLRHQSLVNTAMIDIVFSEIPWRLALCFLLCVLPLRWRHHRR